MRTPGGLVLVFAWLSGACAESATTTASVGCDRSIAARVSADVLASEPRDHCLEGAWVTWTADLAAPVPVRLIAHGNDTALLRIGDGDLGDPAEGWDALTPLLQRREVLDLIPGGECTTADDAGVAANTLVIHVALCSMTLGEVAQLLAERWSDDPRLRDRAAAVCVHLTGERGPRCASDDPACGPQPGGSLAPGRVAPVEPLRCPSPAAIDSYDRGSCRHDGECMISGCGNACVQWSLVPRRSLCPRVPGTDWCGCVAGRCAWFQAR